MTSYGRWLVVVMCGLVAAAAVETCSDCEEVGVSRYGVQAVAVIWVQGTVAAVDI